MQIKKSIALATTLAVSFAFAPTQLAAQAPIASGFASISQPGGLRTFSFTAVKLKDGSIKGQTELHVRSRGARFHSTISSMFVDPAGNLWLAGPVTQSTAPATAPPAVGNTAFILLRRKNGVVQVSLMSFAPPTLSTAAAIAAVFGTPPERIFLPPALINGHLTLN